MVAKLGYWKIRGLAQPIRLLLEFVGEPYEEVLYDEGDKEKWHSEKFNLGLELPNLPYYIDDHVKLTQSLTILRYIAEKHGLSTVGVTPEERARISMIEGAVIDLRFGLGRIAYSPQFEQLKVDYLKNLPSILQMWSKFLGERKYLMGDSVTHLDFLLYEALDVHKHLEMHCLDQFTNLVQFMHHIEELPKIKAYMGSSRFIKWPLHMWFAPFGGGHAPPS
ncbi:unnamed protein product [Echinostoma caproni]|uniref:glutathione transferase n=1 Tax=Echinostoma caproni TaxID=27848 RepID=A0A183B7Z6_9TREM|nr:unnamed protein product [Echinostoma caproni]